MLWFDRWQVAAALAAASVGGCALPHRAPATEQWPAPPSTSVVAIAGPSLQFVAEELHQLEGFVDRMMPGDVLIVTLPTTVPLRTVYIVKSGDTLSSIARAFGVSLSALEAENPQLTQVNHRNPNVIYVGEAVNIPMSQAPRRTRAIVLTRAPDGPPRPNLLELPARPKNATSFEMAQWNSEVETDRQVNDRIEAAWVADTNGRLKPWRAATKALLERISADPAIAEELAGGVDLATTIQEEVTTLRGLPGRHVLLLAPGGDAIPSLAGLTGIAVVVADVDDPSKAAAWTTAATSGGAAKVSVETPELSGLGLPAAVAGTGNTEGNQ